MKVIWILLLSTIVFGANEYKQPNPAIFLNTVQTGQSTNGASLTAQAHLKIIGPLQNTTQDTFLEFARDRNPGNQYVGAAAFKLNAYAGGTGGVPPASQLTFSLKSTSDNFDVSNVDVMVLQDNGNVGIGPTQPVDALSISVPVKASNTHALLNLTDTALSSGSAAGTYIGANPLTFTGDFLRLQIGNVNKYTIESTGTPAATTDLTNKAYVDSKVGGALTYSTTATAGGTTTLVVGSNFNQFFTGTLAQSVVLPAASTLALGQQFQVFNNSTGLVTVQANGGASLIVMAASSSCIFTVTNISSGPGVWNLQYVSNTNLFVSSQVTTTSTAISSTTFLTASNSPAFTFTPAITGTYKVYCMPPLYAGTASTQAMGRIVNTTGSATLLFEAAAIVYGNSGDHMSSVPMQSIYTLTGGTLYVFDIQGKVDANAMLFHGAVIPFYMFAERLH